jgi:transglutaminase-like putative cysteine protease
MMLYEIRHRTSYDYAYAAPTARLVFRITPLSRRGQTMRRHRIDVTPTPRSLRHHLDFFGNPYAVAIFDTPHDELIVEAHSQVEVARPPIEPALDPGGWEETTRAALEALSLGPDSPAHFLYPSPQVRLAAEVTEYARASFSSGRSAFDGAVDLMTRIRADFDYEPAATDVSTPLAEAFAARRGVCQDFAHVMIAGLRGLGLPARYVSGYIRTIPPEGQARLEGADATHAWVDAWCGPSLGWVGLDPTNAILADDDHIEVALGRDFSDVSPIYGVVLGSGEQSLRVEVDVIPIPSARG